MAITIIEKSVNQIIYVHTCTICKCKFTFDVMDGKYIDRSYEIACPGCNTLTYLTRLNEYNK